MQNHSADGWICESRISNGCGSGGRGDFERLHTARQDERVEKITGERRHVETNATTIKYCGRKVFDFYIDAFRTKRVAAQDWREC